MNAYELVTKRIIEKMENGFIPWAKPWIEKEARVDQRTATLVAFNRITKRAYSFTNQCLLLHKGEYATLKQWNDVGGRIRKGSKAEIVIFWKWLEEEKTKTDKDGNEEITIKKTPYLRFYQVFHISSVEGVEPIKDFGEETEQQFKDDSTAENVIDKYFEEEGIILSYLGNRAYYSPATDSITIPERFKFKQNKAGFYSTIFHEMAHSTGHESRLDRLKGNAFFGSEEYSKEELVAEISAASILATLNLENDCTLTNSTAYLQSWIKVLNNDKRMFIYASMQADKAISFILDR